MSSNAAFSHDGLRLWAWRLAQVLLGAIVATVVALLPADRVDPCDDGWRAVPIALLVVAALLLIPAVRFAGLRLALFSCAFVLAGWSAWVLYFGNALGCE